MLKIPGKVNQQIIMVYFPVQVSFKVNQYANLIFYK